MPDDTIVYEWFANFVTEKARKRKKYVSTIVNKEPYSYITDFYLKLRRNLVSIIKKNKSLTDLNDILKSLLSIV